MAGCLVSSSYALSGTAFHVSALDTYSSRTFSNVSWTILEHCDLVKLLKKIIFNDTFKLKMNINNIPAVWTSLLGVGILTGCTSSVFSFN